MSMTTLLDDDITNSSDIAMVTAASAGMYGMNMALAKRAKEIAQLGLYIGIGFYIPVLVLGLVGNSLSFYILKKKLPKTSTYTYLTALAVVDSLFLFI